jgi:peptidoglycan hydrolase-like protein with peptidoglycan-binding domain
MVCSVVVGSCSSGKSSDTSPTDLQGGSTTSVVASSAAATESSLAATPCRPGVSTDPAEASRLRWPTLKRGTTSDRVLVMQHLLAAAKVIVSVDGKFGPATMGAVKRFQLSTDSTQTGIVDASDWLHLVGLCLPENNAEYVEALQFALRIPGYKQPITGELDLTTVDNLARSRADSGAPAGGAATAADWLTLVGVGD